MKPNYSSIRKVLAVATVALVAGVWGACSTEESSTPSAPSGPSVPSAPGSSTWVIDVNVNPPQLALPPEGSTSPVPTSTVTFTVRRQSDGTLAPSGLSLVATVTGGTLAAPLCPGSTVQYCIQLIGGGFTTQFTPSAAGTATIVAAVDGAAPVQRQIQVLAVGEAVFLLSHVEPSVVDPAGGDVVTVFGSNIVAPVRVVIGGTPARVLGTTSDAIQVEVPPSSQPVNVGQTLAVAVTVTNGIGTEFEAVDSLANGITYAHGGSVTQPQIFSVTPTTGPQEGGTPIVINGTGFLTPVQVLFIFPGSGVELEAQVDNASSTQLRVRTPDIRTFVDSGTLVSPVAAQIRVINLDNGFSATASQQFFYGSVLRLTSITPGEGSYQGGESVTITGNGFEEPLTVTIGGLGQQVLQVSGTQIVIRTRGLENATCGGRVTQPVQVTMVEGGATAGGLSFTYNGPPNPRIFGVNPTTGNVGTGVTILGDGFDSPVSVLFGGSDGSAAAVTAVSATSISATVPTPPPGFSFDTQACDGNGDGIPSGERNVPTRIAITVTNLDTGCTVTLSNAFTLNPSDTTCRNDTSTPPPPAQCADGIDNDGDGLIDFGPNPTNDPQCTSPADNSEST